MKLNKSFYGGPGGGFLEKSPLVAEGKSNFIAGAKKELESLKDFQYNNMLIKIMGKGKKEAGKMSKFWFKQKRTASTSSWSRSYVLIPFIIALLIIPGDLTARSGAQLLIEKRDQQQLEGELINVDVEEKNLVLRTYGEGFKIYMDEVESIRIKRKSTGWSAAGKGFLIGAGIGAGVALISYSDPHGEVLISRRMYMFFLAGIFGILGAIHGGVAGPYKKRIQVKGRSQSAIKKILKRLKRKALIKN